MKTNQNGFAAVLVVLIAAVALAGAGAYFYVTQTAKPKPAPVARNEVVVPPATQVSASDTADWQSYSNGQYGFEIKYPKSLVGHEQTYGDNSNAAGGIKFLFPEDISKLWYMEFSADRQVPETMTGPMIPDKCEIPDVNGFDNLKSNITNKNIGGINFTKVEFQWGDKDLSYDSQIKYIAKAGDVCYRFDYTHYKNLNTESDTQNFEKMVSTFKFVEPQVGVAKTEILARLGQELRGQAEKVQLADGTMCVFVNGATAGNAKNERMNYQCGDAKNLSMAIYGDLTEGDVWTANVSNIEYDATKKVWNVLSVKTVDIAKLWR